MPQTADAAPTTFQRVGVILGVVVYVATGFLYLTSGLVVPGWPLVVLWLIWLVGMWYVARLVARWSWWTLATGPAAVLFWVTYLSAGEAWFGWTP